MKILEIHIYGYGKLENVVLKNLNDFQVFYGENEAGKSTIMSFIHSMLFGFPTKQQAELRYEPKTGSAYGGKLVLLFQEQGKVVVERIKGKAAGDVYVLLQDGTRGGEELLHKLLSSIDKHLYQSIFSFNLQGLQNVHLLKNEDIGKFLFSAGLMGSDRLMEVEGQLQKELEAKFKPNGKKPYLNEKLKELKQVNHDLLIAKEHNERYGELLQERDKLQNQIVDVQKEISKLHKEIDQFEQWKNIIPLLREEQLLIKEMEQFDGFSFPVDGIKRLEQLNQLLKPYEAQSISLIKKVQSLQDELNNSQPNEMMLQKEVEITATIEKLPLLEQLQQEDYRISNKISAIDAEIEQIEEKLHITIDEELLISINTSISMKDKTEEAQKTRQRLLEKKIELDEIFNEEKRSLEEIEQKIASLKTQLLEKEERLNLEQRVDAELNKDRLTQELTAIQDRMALFNQTKQQWKKQKAQNRVGLLLMSLIALAALVWGISTQQWMITGISGILFVLVLYLTFSNNTKDSFQPNLDELRKKEKIIYEQLNSPRIKDVEFIVDLLKKDQNIQEQLSILSIKKEQQEEQYEKIIQSFDEWEKNIKTNETILLELGSALRLPKEMALKHIHDAFLLLEKYKSYVREKRQLKLQWLQNKDNIESIAQSFKELAKMFLDSESINIQETAIHIRNNLKQEMEKKIVYKEKESKLKDLLEEQSRLQIEMNYLLKDRQTLFQLAKIHNEEDYREAGIIEEKRIKISQRLEEISSQLHLSNFDRNQIEILLGQESIDALIINKVNILSRQKEELPKLQEQLADIKHQIQLLEEGGTYTELLHKFKEMQHQFAVDSKEWARVSIAKEILSKTIEKFKNERLPNMLTHAEKYLSFLTDNEYIRILPKEAGSGFLIERRDHTVFEANELSQATTEQVYVSLRLALATTLYEKFHFPIIIDDSFVNFDHKRTARIIELLKGLKGKQILFFTCHQHLLSFFKEEELIHLRSMNNQQILEKQFANNMD